MSASLTAFAYLVASVLFVLALRGLSSPATARRGNRYGMGGMAIAVATTLLIEAPVPPGGFLPAPNVADLQTLAEIVGADAATITAEAWPV